MGARGGVVMEGRDIGTVVLPQAAVKVFLTASLEERARRRRDELAARGTDVSVRRRSGGTSARGTRGTVRVMWPPWFRRPTRRCLDSDRLSVDEVVAAILRLHAEALDSHDV